jgi:hypothetical protein
VRGTNKRIYDIIDSTVALMTRGLDTIMKPLKIGGKNTKLLFSEEQVGYDKVPTIDYELANKAYVDDLVHNPPAEVFMDKDLTLAGDLTINGNTLTFGNGEIIHNQSDGLFTFTGSDLIVDKTGSSSAAKVALFGDSSFDASLLLYNAVLVKWSIGNDANDSNKLKFDAGNATVGGATKATLDASGNFLTAGTITDGSGNVLGSSGGGASALNDLSDVSYSSGDLTITSLDKIVADDFVVDSGASIELDSHNGNFVAKKAGNEFSAANSAYAGMILGYTRLTSTGGTTSFEIQNSMTVEHDNHKITFKTPPSERVEIEMAALINIVSTSTHIETSLSTQNATDGYSALSQEYEYDGIGVFHSDGEADDEVINIKWVLDSDDLADVGSDNTFWAAFSTNGETKTAYLQYGGRLSVGQGNHPFIMKATALPATIYDGS